MQLEPLEPPADQPRIQRYRPGGFLIAGRTVRGSVLIVGKRVLSLAASSLAAVDAKALAPLLCEAPRPDLVILGSGARFEPPPAALLRQLKDQGLAAEAMATPAACRTFNLLLAEERFVAALLIALPT